MSRALPYALHVCMPLVVGFALYVFLAGRFLPVRPVSGLHASLVVHYIPDGLWAYATSAFLRILWRPQTRIVSLLFIATPLLFEVAQGFHWAPGVFDWIDCLVMLVFAGTTMFAIDQDRLKK